MDQDRQKKIITKLSSSLVVMIVVCAILCVMALTLKFIIWLF